MDRAVTCAVVLAAGRGERLGGVAKALLRAGDRTFLAAILNSARAAGVDRAVVVVGPPFADAVASEARTLGAELVLNPDPSRGMSSSVACAFAHLLATAGEEVQGTSSPPARRYKAPPPRGEEVQGTASLLWPVDHAFVGVETVREVLGAGGEIVVPRFGGRGGHPVKVAASVWPALAACPAGGAREVLADRRYRRLDIEVDDPGVVRDVDTPVELTS